MSEKMIPENKEEALKELELFSAKNLVIEELINNPVFYSDFMSDLRRRMLFEKVKIKLFKRGMSDE
jgi:hypothetical protein